MTPERAQTWLNKRKRELQREAGSIYRRHCFNRYTDLKPGSLVLKRMMKRYGRPGTIVTDRLRSYGAAMKENGILERQDRGRWLNNRVRNSHQPFRRREGAMSRFRDTKTLQKFATVHASIHNHFNQDRQLNRRDIFKQTCSAGPGRVASTCSLRGLDCRFFSSYINALGAGAGRATAGYLNATVRAANNVMTVPHAPQSNGRTSTWRACLPAPTG